MYMNVAVCVLNQLLSDTDDEIHVLIEEGVSHEKCQHVVDCLQKINKRFQRFQILKPSAAAKVGSYPQVFMRGAISLQAPIQHDDDDTASLYLNRALSAGLDVHCVPLNLGRLTLLICPNYLDNDEPSDIMDYIFKRCSWRRVKLVWHSKPRAYSPWVFDFVLCNRMDKRLLKARAPLIIFERSDSVRVGVRTRKTLQHPMVHRMYREYVNVDKSQYNESLDRPHYHLLNEIYDMDDANRPPPQHKMTPSDLVKLQAFMWNPLQYGYASPFCLRLHEAPVSDKPIDVFAICHHPPIACLNRHRTHMQEVVESLRARGLKVVTNTKDIPRPRYFEMLLQSKVAVSPFGFGERIALDQYGLAARCIVVKPAMPFVNSSPDFLAPDMLEWTPPDWSRLAEDCLEVVNHWDDKYKALALRRYQLMRHMRSPTYYINLAHQKLATMVARPDIFRAYPALLSSAETSKLVWSSSQSYIAVGLRTMHMATNRSVHDRYQKNRAKLHHDLRSLLQDPAPNVLVGLPASPVDMPVSDPQHGTSAHVLLSEACCSLLSTETTFASNRMTSMQVPPNALVVLVTDDIKGQGDLALDESDGLDIDHRVIMDAHNGYDNLPTTIDHVVQCTEEMNGGEKCVVLVRLRSNPVACVLTWHLARDHGVRAVMV